MPGGYQQTGNAYQGFAGGKYAYQQIVGPSPSPAPSQAPAGRPAKRRLRYIARFDNELYEFRTLSELEQFVATTEAIERNKPRRVRQPIKIVLPPRAAMAEYVPADVHVPEIDTLPLKRALEFLRQIDEFNRSYRRLIDDEDDEWLMM